MSSSNQKSVRLLRFVEILYLFLIVLSFYLLFLSRTGETHTVWEVLHPAFIPTLLVTTSLLLAIVLTSKIIPYKLLFIVIHSVLLHSFFSIIFPAGDWSGQQMVLGRTRLVYDNVVIHGLSSGPAETIPFLVYQWFRGINFQAALSVIFARAFDLDIFWIHLFLVPVLWGVFAPIAAFLITTALGGNNKVSALSSILITAFPYLTYFGAISVPDSLGFIFFFFVIYFILKDFESNNSKNQVLILGFSFLSFLSHSLTGIMAISLLILAFGFKTYRSEKSRSSGSKVSVIASFVLGAGLLPLSLIYLRLFRPDTHIVFTLDKLHQLPLWESVGRFLVGQLIYSSDFKSALLIIIGPVLGLSYMIYYFFKLKRSDSAQSRLSTLFLSAAFLLILVDYGILNLFMDGLQGLLNPERLWVFRDFIAVPFVALAIHNLYLSLETFLKAHSNASISDPSPKRSPMGKVPVRVFSLLIALNVLIPVIMSGWIVASLSAAYPQVAPLQTTWYELEAAKFIDENTREKYVVIGDDWAVYAGEMIVGINNPRAYYFEEFSKTGRDLFVNMTQDPSPKWMLQAMNYTSATVAFFIVTEPRLGTEQFNNIISEARDALTVFHVTGDGKLYIFIYRKE